MANAYRSILKDAVNPTGNALPADVLSGKTFSNADGIDKTGTMVNNGAVSIILTDHDPTYTIPEGYHNGNGIVSFSASGGGGPDLIVTCSSAFAGAAISCTDGTTTLTDVCPSSSPYEVTFNLPNVGTWTVSGTISGTTYTESVLVQNINVELKSNIDVSVNFYSSANDTVSYVGLDGQSHTITTDIDGHATATITIDSSGSSFTFVSSVAKDPSNSSNYFSKILTLTPSTSNIYLMPDGNVFYWYGWKSANIQTAPYKPSDTTSSNSSGTIEYNTNSARLTAGNSSLNYSPFAFLSPEVTASDATCRLIGTQASGASNQTNLYLTNNFVNGYSPLAKHQVDPWVGDLNITLQYLGSSTKIIPVIKGYKPGPITISAIWLE